MENHCGGDGAEGHRRDQRTAGFAPRALQGRPSATAATPKRGHTEALMGCQQPTGAFSAQQTWELASHIILVPYQVLTTGLLLLNPSVYYVEKTEARSVNRESGVRPRLEWKQIFFKRLLDIARFITLLLKFSCQNNIWLKKGCSLNY